MKIEVRYFASLVELTGRVSETLEVGEEADVLAVWSVLADRYPSLARLSYRPLVACDMAYADWDTPVAGVREVAFLPPVSGG
jgi:molybdopterin converting factor small subunit